MHEEMFPDEYIEEEHTEEIPADEFYHPKSDIDYGIKKLKMYQARHKKLETEKKANEIKFEEFNATKTEPIGSASCRAT